MFFNNNYDKVSTQEAGDIMRYIDYGTIVDVESIISDEWYRYSDYRFLPSDERIKFMQLQNWKTQLQKAKVIKDAIEKLKEMDPRTSAILTDVYSMQNDGIAKVEYLRDAGVKQDIIMVPYFMNQTDIVNAKGNILIADAIHNLVKWEEAGGYPILFDIDKDDIDIYGRANTYLYQKTDDISVEKKKRSF